MKFEFSAGGVVFKEENGKRYILIAQHSQHHGWVFPKGLIGDKQKETKQETALREVKEETGVTAKIIQEITPTTYWYQWEGEKRKKTVYYFVMEYISENSDERDLEMERVEWVSIEDIENRLTYQSDKNVWKEAQKVLTNLPAL